MFRRRVLLGFALITVAGCTPPSLPPGQPPAPPPRRASTSASARRQAPTPVSLDERIRQEPWLTRFWEELTPAQRRRVRGRLDKPEDEAAAAWDGMGLPQREATLFGN